MATPLETAIDAATPDPLVRAAMRLGALLEGGSLAGPWQAGDNGLSYGPYQIYSAAHPVSRAQAEDPQFATTYMLASYRDAAARLRATTPNLEQSNPMMAAALTAYWAEKPLVMYAETRIRAAWDTLIGGTQPQPQPGPPPSAAPPGTQPGSIIANPADGIGQAVQAGIAAWLAGLVQQFRQFWSRDRVLRIAVVIIGAVLLVEGALAVASPAVGRAVEVISG